MQTVSTAIREARVAQAIAEGQVTFAARQAQVSVLAETIVTEGQPELHADSTALCSHFKLRHGNIEGQPCEAQVYSHPAGTVIRFWVYPGDFSVRVRDLILLPAAGEKGLDLWLDTRADGPEGRLFPHGGKYVMPGLKILAHHVLGR